MLIKCPYCNQEYSDYLSECPYCHAKRQQADPNYASSSDEVHQPDKISRPTDIKMDPGPNSINVDDDNTGSNTYQKEEYGQQREYRQNNGGYNQNNGGYNNTNAGGGYAGAGAGAGAVNPLDKAGCFGIAFSVIFPLIGLILFLVNRNSYPNKAKSYGIAALIGVGLNLLTGAGASVIGLI